MKEHILVVDKEQQVGQLLLKILKKRRYEVSVVETGESALKLIAKKPPHLVLLDLSLPDIDGLTMLAKLREVDGILPVIVLTGHENVRTAVEAMKIGACDYLPKPFNNEELLIIIEKALKNRKLERRVEYLRRQIDKLLAIDTIIGSSGPMQKVFKMIQSIAPYDVSVILRGESGTGKELVAKAIHYNSLRRESHFVALDCATLPETLVESEVFGYQKGAFTGAMDTKIGKFELAQNGTLLLDEVGNLSLQVQAKLLRVLEERVIERLGGKQPIEIDVRLISATNSNLEEEISQGKFREDLYHRINEFTLFLPPLRQRNGDIPLLAQYFVQELNEQLGKNVQEVSQEALDLFETYRWPGNVRELKNCIKRAMLLAKEVIEIEHLPPHILQNEKHEGFDFLDELDLKRDISLKEASKIASAKVEKQLISRVLREFKGNRGKTAAFLSIDSKTLYNKIKEYKIAV